MAGLSPHPAAAADPGRPHPPGAPHHGGVQGLRPDLDHDPRRPGELDADDRHLRVPDRIPGLRLRAGGGARLPHRAGDHGPGRGVPASPGPNGADRMSVESAPRASTQMLARVRRHRLNQPSPITRVLLYAGLIVALLVILAPFAWLIISSVAAPVDLLERPLKWIPAHITFDRFASLTFGATGDENAEGFRAALVNSTVIASSVTALSLVGVLWRVIVPISIPGLLSTALLAFLMAWDEFLYALIMTQTPASKTLPVAINDFIGRHGLDFGLLATGGVIAALPPVIIAFVFQRYLEPGDLAAGLPGLQDGRIGLCSPRGPVLRGGVVRHAHLAVAERPGCGGRHFIRAGAPGCAAGRRRITALRGGPNQRAAGWPRR